MVQDSLKYPRIPSILGVLGEIGGARIGVFWGPRVPKTRLKPPNSCLISVKKGVFGGVFGVFLGCFGEGVKKGVFPCIYTYLKRIMVRLKKQAKNVANLEKKYFFNVLKNLYKNSAKYRKICTKK